MQCTTLKLPIIHCSLSDKRKYSQVTITMVTIVRSKRLSYLKYEMKRLRRRYLEC